LANKQKLAQYTWQDTETISIKGDVKDTKIYQVQTVMASSRRTWSTMSRRNPAAGKAA